MSEAQPETMDITPNQDGGVLKRILQEGTGKSEQLVALSRVFLISIVDIPEFLVFFSLQAKNVPVWQTPLKFITSVV